MHQSYPTVGPQAAKATSERKRENDPSQESRDNVVLISHLRDHLGNGMPQVAETDAPIIVPRYNATDVAIVPL
jgi:hypothetical protein